MTDETILLIRRSKNQSFGAGLYSMVGGKVEQGETTLKAIALEVYKETKLVISESDFQLVHTLHRKGTESEFITLYFKVNINPNLTPINNEPDKHDDIKFFNITQLPQNIIPAHQQVISTVLKGISYSEDGWQ